MAKHLTLIVSNIGLPSTRIGSWVTRINRLLASHQPFDYILSPSEGSDRNIFCQKKKFFTHNKRLRKKVLLQSVASDYIKAVMKLSEQAERLTIVVMDDPHLIEAMVLSRNEMACEVVLTFSFHGFQLELEPTILTGIDHILFLSNAGYLASKSNYFSFTPQVSIVGNGIDSQQFFPLTEKDKTNLKLGMGYKADDRILIWMANDRPSKGLHIFKEVALQLVEKNTDLKVMIIGSEEKMHHKGIQSIGRVPNAEIATYLQVGDVYAFTTLCKEGFGLSMIEALKCGNKVVASNNGAVAEVLSGLANTSLVFQPNSVSAWIAGIEKALAEEKVTITSNESAAIWNYKDWEERYLKAIRA